MIDQHFNDSYDLAVKKIAEAIRQFETLTGRLVIDLAMEYRETTHMESRCREFRRHVALVLRAPE